MALMRLNPVRDMWTLRRAMDRLFDENWVADYNGNTPVTRLPVDAYSTDNEIVIMAPVPGVNPEDVEIMVEGETLTIRGEVPARVEGMNYIFRERFHGPFERVLRLNVPVNVDGIEATFNNGLLTVVLPKAEEIRPKVIKVQAK